MQGLDLRRITADDDDIPFDAAALMTHIISTIGNAGFILIVHDLKSTETRQFSNGPFEAQLEILVQACNAMKAAISGSTH